MKLFYNALLVIFCINCGDIYAQEKPTTVTELAQTYSDYFTLNRESVFLHLNKTTVVPSEDLWFSAYVYNTKFQEPSLATTNLHVNLYNSAGKLMEAKTVFIENGLGNGYFELDSLYSPGKYVIKASTNYMKNFRENLSFSQTFTILGKNNTAKVPIKYDLQLLPEGGHLVANVINTVGVKLIDNSGKGVSFTNAKVLNGAEETIRKFKSNRFGLSKFTFIPKTDERYSVVLTTKKGKEIRKEIMPPKTRGFALSTNAMLPEKVVFSLSTNANTFNNLVSNQFFMAFQKNGAIKVIKFSIPEEDLEATVEIPRKSLYSGMNIITVFNQNLEPVLERLVFNRKG